MTILLQTNCYKELPQPNAQIILLCLTFSVATCSMADIAEPVGFHVDF